MKPVSLIERQPLELWSQETHEIPAHRQENHKHVHRQDKTGTSRHPY
jgi:hypothetical protein